MQFHLTDDCNIRCKDCHWFSQPIVRSKKQPTVTDYIRFFHDNEKHISGVRFSGGEPTLFPEFVQLVKSAISIGTFRVDVFSNGTNTDIVGALPQDIRLFISTNREVTDEFIRLYKERFCNVKFLTYTGKAPNLPNQLTVNDKLRSLVGSSCVCNGKNIRFGSDGFAYHCEVGMRTKDVSLRTGISVWTPDISKYTEQPHTCTVKDGCLSCIKTEQNFLAM